MTKEQKFDYSLKAYFVIAGITIYYFLQNVFLEDVSISAILINSVGIATLGLILWQIILIMIGKSIDARIEKEKLMERLRFEKKVDEFHDGMNEERDKQIDVLIEQHIKVLARKRKSLVMTYDYGVEDPSAWEREKSYFFNNVIAVELVKYITPRVSQIAEEMGLPTEKVEYNLKIDANEVNDLIEK